MRASDELDALQKERKVCSYDVFFSRSAYKYFLRKKILSYFLESYS